jgi:hypothetical protein
MNGIYLEIPGPLQAQFAIPPQQLEMELLRRLVSAMYADELVGGSAGCMMTSPEKSKLHDWRSCPDSVQPLCSADYELERRNLTECLKGG